MKKTTFIATAALFIASSAFSVEQQSIDLGRYNAIVNAFDAEVGGFAPGFMSKNIADDIRIVETYTKNLQAKLAIEKQNKWATYVSPVCNVAGYGLSGVALMGATFATFGAFGLSAAYGVGGYLDVLWFVFGRKVPYGFGVAPDLSREEKNYYYVRYPELQGGRDMDSLVPGILAPIVAAAAFASARTARYLFNKAESYRAELIKIEQEIAQSQKIIEALQMLQ